MSDVRLNQHEVSSSELGKMEGHSNNILNLTFFKFPSMRILYVKKI